MKTIEIKARGLTFEALAEGPEDGPLLILLHGLPRSPWEWHHQIPAMAAMGYKVVAPSLRGFCAGARPDGVEAYHVKEYADDTLAIADALAGKDTPFHLMGSSIGSPVAWWIAAKNPARIKTLACLNIPHPGALAAAQSKSKDSAEEQREKFAYFKKSSEPGNERTMFDHMLKEFNLPEDEAAPYLKFRDDNAALVAIYNWYRAIPLWQRERLEPVTMPTLFVWPPGSGNISRTAAEATADQATGPYRLEIVEDVHQPILQAAPEKLTNILTQHLKEHGDVS